MEITREVLFETEPAEVWAALTEPEQLEQWFANDVEIDVTPGGRAVFRWENGESREATVEDVELERRLALRWLDGGGDVVLELVGVPEGTLLYVTETASEFSAALGLRALALCTIA
jgi:uncharacterized protein YndB with AHSA1/START domain